MAATPEVRDPDPPSAEPAGGGAHAMVARNTALLMLGQILGMPLIMLMNAVMARKLGAQDFGYIYLAGTLVTFGFLIVEWGQGATLQSVIPKDRSHLRGLVGTGMAWRVTTAVVVYGGMAGVSAILGYDTTFQKVLFLVVLAKIFNTVCGTILDSARGLEITGPTAINGVRFAFLCSALVIPTALLGGSLAYVLTALLIADIVNTGFVCRNARALGMTPLSVDKKALKILLSTGTSFMLLSLALTLQPNIDAVILSKMATPQAMGWYAAARKLVGVLVFPITALSGALYPTLCRLFVEDRASFQRMVSTSLRTATILVVPASVGAALYPELGIKIFSEASFAPAEDDLRVLSLFILLLYFTMLLGSAIAAAGRQRIWTAMQFACVAVSAVADPLLIPWFERHWANGGLGVCVSSVLSEALMIAGGFVIAPRGLLDRPLMKGIALSFVAGGAMIFVSRELSFLNPFLGATLSVAAYLLCLWAIGGIDRGTLQTIRSIAARKIPRPAAT
jgi:O-antigen/teichoic acid export membrane protein